MATAFALAPAYTPLGQRLQERTDQLQSVELDAQHGYAHGHLCEGMMHGFQQIAEMIDPPDPAVPWQPLFDINLTPDWALPWLAQAVGVRLPQTITPDQARQLILGLGIHKRGTVGAIQQAGDAFFDPAKPHRVFFRERDSGDPYRLEIVVDEGGLPETDRELVNHISNPRPNGGAGWTLDWQAGNPPGVGGVINPLTFGVWDPPNNPPSLHSADITGHAGPNVGQAFDIAIVPTTIAAFDPLPTPTRFMTGAIYVYPVKGLIDVRLGFLRRRADGANISVGGFRSLDSLEERWHRIDAQDIVGSSAAFGGHAVTSYGLSLTVTPIPGQDFELSLSSAIATERDFGDVAAYGDPITNFTTWDWNGAADNSASHRVQTTIVRDAYQSQIPAGILLAYRSVSAWDYQAMTDQGGTYEDQSIDYLNYENLSENKKG